MFFVTIETIKLHGSLRGQCFPPLTWRDSAPQATLNQIGSTAGRDS